MTKKKVQLLCVSVLGLLILCGTSIPSYASTNKNSNIHLNLKNHTTFHNSIASKIDNSRKFTEENYKELVKTIKINSSTAFVGDKIFISAETINNVKLKEFNIYYTTKTGSVMDTLKLEYNFSTNRYEGTINVIDKMINEVVFLDSFYAVDFDGNEHYDTVSVVGDSAFYVLDKNNIGWNKVDNFWFYINSNKNIHKGWLLDSGKWYYLGTDGFMQTGWITVNNIQYYLYSNGSMASNTWIDDYYVGNSGEKYINRWIGDYYCGSDGKYVKNQWVSDYYCDSNGKYVKNKWVGDYYCNSNGKYVKNQWVGDYYCGSDGKYVKNQWVKTSGKWYYCDNNGKYLKNTSELINNKYYTFDATGVCINP